MEEEECEAEFARSWQAGSGDVVECEGEPSLVLLDEFVAAIRANAARRAQLIADFRTGALQPGICRDLDALDAPDAIIEWVFSRDQFYVVYAFWYVQHFEAIVSQTIAAAVYPKLASNIGTTDYISADETQRLVNVVFAEHGMALRDMAQRMILCENLIEEVFLSDVAVAKDYALRTLAARRRRQMSVMAEQLPMLLDDVPLPPPPPPGAALVELAPAAAAEQARSIQNIMAGLAALRSTDRMAGLDRLELERAREEDAASTLAPDGSVVRAPHPADVPAELRVEPVIKRPRAAPSTRANASRDQYLFCAKLFARFFPVDEAGVVAVGTLNACMKRLLATMHRQPNIYARREDIFVRNNVLWLGLEQKLEPTHPLSGNPFRAMDPTQSTKSTISFIVTMKLLYERGWRDAAHAYVRQTHNDLIATKILDEEPLPDEPPAYLAADPVPETCVDCAMPVETRGVEALSTLIVLLKRVSGKLNMERPEVVASLMTPAKPWFGASTLDELVATPLFAAPSLANVGTRNKMVFSMVATGHLLYWRGRSDFLNTLGADRGLTVALPSSTSNSGPLIP